MSDTAISVTDLRKSYGATEAVRGIDFEVRTGEIFGFLGANGAGKTTTIEILEGYRERSGGEVSVLGVDPQHATRAWRGRVGLVLQECELNPLMTVRETVGLFASFYPRPRDVAATIALVDLGDVADVRVAKLSGGQRRRVDVALGIVGDPDLIFLDEPTTGFDPSARRGAWQMIEGLRELGKTVFLTTHYMDEAEQLADRVAIMRAGEIVAQGAMDDLLARFEQRTLVRFRLPAGIDPADARAAVGEEVIANGGGLTSFRTPNAQRALYRLTSWAERSSIALDGLEATAPSLEEVFLAVTGGDGGEQRG